jgi:hypothetical protein
MRNNKSILDEIERAVRRNFIGSVAGTLGLLGVLAVIVYGTQERPATRAPSTTAPLSASADSERAGATADVTTHAPDRAPPSSIVSTAPSPSVAESPLADRVGEQQTPSAPIPAEKASEAPTLTASPKSATADETPKSAAKQAPVRQAGLGPDAEEFPKPVVVQLPLPKPPLSPAQRLELHGKDYDRAERCLAQAIYFEARNEPARGQQAVAQVVLNRVFSPYYPKDVCSVVYQNAHRHLSCQFTFACDGRSERVNERAAWSRANRIAMQTLNARVWLPEVNKATHYHAAYVRPNWIRDMKVMVRYGLHIFYRPRNWGDGSNEAHWGTASSSVKPAVAAAKPAAVAARRSAATSHGARRSVHRRAYARYYGA